ncbi:D-alanine--D-alanine ligase family protein [Rubrivirga marina]|uniref:D-alanine--D-alanine ligase family protein n=1 Tax=Rubrivirga marina TaxID=1196024 RepID=UPI000BA9C5AC|nr:D-alanine--D-alanine ligase [Rubrivirga marina]
MAESRNGPLRVGLCYDRFGDAPRPPGAPPDWDAEYEPEETVAALEAALRRLGHEPVRLGNAAAVLARMPDLGVDAAVNIAESYGSRNREAHVPVLLELAGVPCVGSDALSLSVSLDKHLTKTVVAAAGVGVPPGGVVPLGADAGALVEAAGLAFPLMAKPRYEGTAKGITPSSRCETSDGLVAEVARQHALYGQDVVVEAFVDGAEWTVGVVGTGDGARALPALQRAVEPRSGIGVHALPGDPDYVIGGALTPELEERLGDAALAAHRALECRDFSRSDFRVAADGVPVFIEINPLPTFAPDGTFAILAELDGQPYDAFLADVLGAALDRALADSARLGAEAGGGGPPANDR